MKKLGSKVISLFIISILIVIFVLGDNYEEIINVLINSNIYYLVLGFIVVLLGDFLKSLSITTIVKKEKNVYTYKEGFLLAIQTNFFNGLTPFCLGGQPFQVYSLKKDEKINYADGVKMVFKDFYSYQIALILISTICLILNKIFDIVVFNNTERILVLIGYLLNLFIGLFLIFLPYLNISKNNAADVKKSVCRLETSGKVCYNERTESRKVPHSARIIG